MKNFIRKTLINDYSAALAFLLIISIAWIILSDDLREQAQRLPRLAAGANIFLITIMLFERAVQAKNNIELSPKVIGNLLVFILSVAYVATFNLLGFFIASIIYLVVFVYIINYENKEETNLKKVALFSVVSVVILYVAFDLGLGVNMPTLII